MRKNNSKARLIFTVFLTALLYGCRGSMMDIRTPPFVISEPEYRDGTEDESCIFGGVYFDFYNWAESRVVFLEIRMNVYDRKTRKSAFPGCGTIKSGNSVLIESGEKRQMCIPLDEYINQMSEGGYLIDQFYVSRIDYEDGRVWIDELGMYALSGRE